MGLHELAGPLAVSLFNGTMVAGTIIMGALTDHIHVTTVILITAVGASLSVFLLWGFAFNLAIICLFSVTYGFFAGGYSAVWAAIVKEIQSRDKRADTGVVFGMLVAGRGVGNVVSGVLSDWLISNDIMGDDAPLGYGTGYGSLIIFAGACAALSGTSWIGRQRRWV